MMLQELFAYGLDLYVLLAFLLLSLAITAGIINSALLTQKEIIISQQRHILSLLHRIDEERERRETDGGPE